MPIAVSVVFHGLLIAPTVPGRHDPPRPPGPRSPQPTAVGTPAVDVILLDESTIQRIPPLPVEPLVPPAPPTQQPPTEPPARAPPPPPHDKPRRVHVAAAGPASPPESGRATALPPTTSEVPVVPSRPNPLAMRSSSAPRALDVAAEHVPDLRSGVSLAITADPRASAHGLESPPGLTGTAPETLAFDPGRPPRERRGLERQHDGTYRGTTPDFTAHVERDGSVRFEDRSNVRPGAGTDDGAMTHGVDPSTIRDRGSIGKGGVGGRMDATDFVMKRKGMDPRGYEKQKFLDETRDQRAELGKQHRSAQLSRAAVLMRSNIQRLWARTADPVERKQVLFELWDECEESGDPETVASGQQARAVVTSFIRSRLHGADAYSATELAQLNVRRRSAARFAPYQ